MKRNDYDIIAEACALTIRTPFPLTRTEAGLLVEQFARNLDKLVSGFDKELFVESVEKLLRKM